MKPAMHEKQTSPYNLLKKHMTADLVATVYGTPEQRAQMTTTDPTSTTSSNVVSIVSQQLARQRVGVIGVDCDAKMRAGTRARWHEGTRHDTCVGEDLLE